MLTPVQYEPRPLVSRLIACSQLTCVVLFGVLLLRPWQAGVPALGAAFILACVAFAIAAIAISRDAAGLVRVVFGSFAALAFALAVSEVWLLLFPRATQPLGLQEASALELAISMAALNALLALYGTYALAAERVAAEALEMSVAAERTLKESLAQRMAERTLELHSVS